MSTSQALQQQQLFNTKIENRLQLHTHPLSSLTQSGAAAGHVPTWNGSTWIAAAQTGSQDAGEAIPDYSNITTVANFSAPVSFTSPLFVLQIGAVIPTDGQVLTASGENGTAIWADPISVGMIDGGFPSDNYSNIAIIDGGTP
jgi:hypothetical protein